MVEQRRSQRYKLALPVRILRCGTAAVSAPGETRNLCSRGVLLASEVRAEVGDPLEFLISFPPTKKAAAVNLRCLGKVLRFERSPLESGEAAPPFQMAATIERYEFHREPVG